jgi:hypothetical protein
MAAKECSAIPNPSVYRVDVVHGEQGSTYQVIRCDPVAKFDNEEHAAFLVALLQEGRANG